MEGEGDRYRQIDRQTQRERKRERTNTKMYFCPTSPPTPMARDTV